MSTTTIIPIIVPQQPPKCPNCHHDENKKVVCRNCGYEYQEEGSGCLIWVIIIAIIAGGIWVAITLMDWFSGHHTLVEVLKSQWDWLTGLFHRIY